MTHHRTWFFVDAYFLETNLNLNLFYKEASLKIDLATEAECIRLIIDDSEIA